MVVRFDPDSGNALAAISTGGSSCRGLTFLNGLVWVADTVAGKLIALDPATNAVVHSYGGFNSPLGLTNDGAYLYVSEDTGSSPTAGIKKVDPATGNVLLRVACGYRPNMLCCDMQGHVWVPDITLPAFWVFNTSDFSLVAEPYEGSGSSAWGIFLDDTGQNMLVGCYGINRVQRYAIAGISSSSTPNLTITLPSGSGVADIVSWSDRYACCLSLLNQVNIYDASGAPVGILYGQNHVSSLAVGGANMTEWWIVNSGSSNCQRARGEDSGGT